MSQSNTKPPAKIHNHSNTHKAIQQINKYRTQTNNQPNKTQQPQTQQHPQTSKQISNQ